ncbi:unnamed protein product [Penicillium salamii]|nr:unnamed protein product [Penicillium salamii]
MKEPQDSNPDTHQFRTPRRPSPQRPTTARRSPESTWRNSRKRTPLPRAQSTLTQIEFVTQPTVPDDEQLEYIDEPNRENTHPAEPPRTNDGSDKDSDYLPAPPVRSARATKMKKSGQEHESSERLPKRRSAGFSGDADRSHRPRKSETPRPSGRSKGSRKQLEKSTGKRNKTLTQMDFVRRYITIADDDDDVDMGYIQPTPRRDDTKSEQKKPLPASNEQEAVKRTTPAKRSRRIFEEELDLSTGDPISQTHATQDRKPAADSKHHKISTPAAPVTPQKSRRSEIPSSQTPESPGLAIITSSQFRGATCSPSKRRPPNPANNSMQHIKKESSEERTVVNDSQEHRHAPPLQRSTTDSQCKHDSLNMPPPNNLENSPSSEYLPEFDSQELPRAQGQISRDKRTRRERTVIYETDADSDYDEAEETANRSSVTPTPKKPSQKIHQQPSSQAQNSPESTKDGSPELPLQSVPSSINWDDAPASEPPMSDTSVCYQRMHAATQFPHEPIPTLNTQKMAELFPSEGNTQIPRHGLFQPPRDPIPGPFSQSQSQTQSQGDKEPTEMVPESSPVRGDESEADAAFQRPRVPQTPQSVVQVESSQAVDRDGQWQGQVLSRSQLLSSSVMESVPMPNFWMGSQDSEAFSNKEGAPSETKPQESNNLNDELQETFRAFSASPWGSRIGGLWDNVRKQGETYYEGARQEYAAASEEAVKGFSGLKDTLADRTKGLSLSTVAMASSGEGSSDDTATPKASAEGESLEKGEGADASGESFISRFKAEAARRLKEIEKAEEAADEAIMRFGMNISQKLREAVSIVPPETDETGKLLFESKDAEGKRVIHATRFEAQLHVIHSNIESFTKDPVSDEWSVFSKEFNVESKTDEIAADLEKYPELRSAMEKVVPEQVEYAIFWTRYYFLRLVVETEEKKRKELLKGANAEDEEEVGWDDDSDSESQSPSTPQVRSSNQTLAATTETPKAEPRRSNDQQSQADSESSYDVVSGAASKTPGSPKEKDSAPKTEESKAEDSDEDWE